MKFPKGKFSPEQRAWCKEYKDLTGWEPHAMQDYILGAKSFTEAAADSIGWFESWSGHVKLTLMRLPVPESENENLPEFSAMR